MSLLEKIHGQTHTGCEPDLTEAPTPAPDLPWRQPEVQKLYDRWVQDHYGVIDMELLCSALYNAGARNAVTAMVTWQDLGGQINRMESRVVSSFNNMRSVLEALTSEDR